MSLSPAPLTTHETLSVGTASTGPFTVSNIDGANYNQPPNMLPNDKILIRKDAYAGTKSNCTAAKGIFQSYKSMSGGNKISTNSNMKGGNKLDAAPTEGGQEPNPRHNTNPKPYNPLVGGKRRRTMKRKAMRKSKRHSKRHHKRSRKMHRRRRQHTRKHKKMVKIMKRKHKKHTRKHKKRSLRHKKRSLRHKRRHSRRMRGGNQPFSNQPLSASYSANLAHLKPSMSGIANPVPIKQNMLTCAKVPRS